MGLFGIKQPKPKTEPKKDSYYIEPTEPKEEENHEAWIEQENKK